MRGRLGRSLTSRQTSHLAGTTDIFSEGLLREFAWCTALLKAQPWRSVRLTVSRQSVNILSDAAWEPGQDGVGVASLCWLVFGTSAPPWGRVLALPPQFLECCVERKTQIEVAELARVHVASHALAAGFCELRHHGLHRLNDGPLFAGQGCVPC